jgi:cytochrome b6-f complex iron-sulfur subunit
MSGRLEPEPIARRDFLGLAGLWAAGIAIFGSVLGMLRLPQPTVMPESASRFRIGRPEDLPPGSSMTIPQQKVLVISEARGIAAISLVCTHLGCIVSQHAEGFSCPCHGSAFASDGSVAIGPAPRGLRWLEVSRAIDGRLVVDAANEVEPDTFLSV